MRARRHVDEEPDGDFGTWVQRIRRLPGVREHEAGESQMMGVRGIRPQSGTRAPTRTEGALGHGRRRGSLSGRALLSTCPARALLTRPGRPNSPAKSLNERASSRGSVVLTLPSLSGVTTVLSSGVPASSSPTSATKAASTSPQSATVVEGVLGAHRPLGPRGRLLLSWQGRRSLRASARAKPPTSQVRWVCFGGDHDLRLSANDSKRLVRTAPVRTFSVKTIPALSVRLHGLPLRCPVHRDRSSPAMPTRVKQRIATR